MICANCNTEFEGDVCPACGVAVTSPASALLAAASALLKEGLADQAIESLEQALTRDPKSYEAHSLLGAAYMRREEYPLAGHHFERAVWLDSGRAAARYNLAVAYRAAGRRDDAVQQLRAALEKDPQHQKSRALLAELEKTGTSGEPAAPGSPENRPRAAAPHLQAVNVRGDHLSPTLRLILAGASSLAGLILGALAYAAIFRLLTSPQLLGRDAVLWAQLPYAFGIIVFFAGVVAASFQAQGFPFGSLGAGLVGLPIGVAMLMAREGEPVTARMILGAALFGGVGAAAIEALAKFTRVGEFRRTLLWVTLAFAGAYVIVGYARQGSMHGYVTTTVGDSNGGQPATVRVPDAQIALTDQASGRTYATISINAEAADLPPSTQGSYLLRGMPVGRYTMTCIEPESGAYWVGEAYVDYAIVKGNEMEIPLVLPLERAAAGPSSARP
jgi:hypothetical protein